MHADDGFADLVSRLRSGDEQAATELVRLYEPQIRREVRTWLRFNRRHLGRLLDSVDICQSVLANFFVRAAAGQFRLDEPGHLKKLLMTMARNKFAEHVRHHQAQRRDIRRTEALGSPGAAAAASPSQLLSGAELLQEFRRRLTAEERSVAELRVQGHDWSAIAAELGGTPDGRRMQLARAASRVARELGLDEENP
jgi:RNA polymerase sigma-70 factor (ECF subfamily)